MFGEVVLSAKVLEIARYSCGFAQSDRLNLRQIQAQILPKVVFDRALNQANPEFVLVLIGFYQRH